MSIDTPIDPVSGIIDDLPSVEAPPSTLEIPSNPLAKFGVHSAQEVVSLFPTSIREMDRIADEAIAELKSTMDKVAAIQSNARNFANSIMQLDTAETAFSVRECCIGAIALCHTDATLRDHARGLQVKLSTFARECLGGREGFRIFREYDEGNRSLESLSEQQVYHLAETAKNFRRDGHYLDDISFQEVQELKKQLTELSSTFAANIANDKSTVQVKLEELAGVPASLIEGLERNGEFYTLSCDYPVVLPVLKLCEVASTRAALQQAFANRAAPDNVEVLRKVINLRDDIAKRIGYSCHADLQLEGQMAGTTATAQAFVDKVVTAATPKANDELALLFADLPSSISLDTRGRIQQSDFAFAKEHYIKKNLNVDEEKLREYFPMESTIEGLFEIYQRFFNLEFHTIPVEGMWHESVQMIEVREKGKSSSPVGHIAIDLYPREGKYTHACCSMIVPPVMQEDGSTAPATSLVIANFPKSTESKPSLLPHAQVRTFFHEFGHAIHALLGRAELPSHAGYNCKLDFVEMPSQILEEWIWETEILKMLGKHYKTGETIPDSMIESKIASKQAFSGTDTLRQMIFANASLEFYKEGRDKDTHAILQRLMEEINPGTAYPDDTHTEANFGHLMGYAAGYYGYMWSKVFALDVFNAIKEKDGLLDPELGRRYVREVIGKGGSCDPSDLLRSFLGREANEDAFKASLGI